MRKPLVIGACLIGAVVVVVAGLFIYAAVNLNSIIADNQQRVLERASAALGRKVEIRDIHASIGWGITAELSGIQIAEAPEFGGQPFVEADSATAAVAFLPLLRSRIHISSLTLKHPQIRIVRAADGRFNVSTLGEKRVKPETAAPRANPAQTACTSAASPLEQVPPEASRKGG
ncbi:MAG TPA: AsmA family protein, partial [Candidatus Binataceae bacterium]|nr:AsmA family protein [Candidatus Binataceae bacterium]